jgi:branched-chain amino acid transport system permease protein
VSRLRKRGEDVSGLAVLATALLLVAVVGASSSLAFERDATTALIYITIALGFGIFTSNSGVMSFGHVGFVSIAAYATALATIPTIQKGAILQHLPGVLQHHTVSSPVALVLVLAFTGLVAFVVGLPIMRLSGAAASIATFAWLLVVYTVASNWTAVTRGRATMIGVPVHTTIWSAALGAIAVLVVAYLFRNSQRGLLLRASRDDEVAARALGVNVVRIRLFAFVLSVAAVAAAGFEYAQLLGAFNPDVFYENLTFTTVAMLVVGGLYSVSGAVVGGILVYIVQQVLRSIEDGTTVGPIDIPARPGLSQVGLALFLLAILIFRPAGITRGNEVAIRPGAVLAFAHERSTRVRARLPKRRARVAKEES